MSGGFLTYTPGFVRVSTLINSFGQLVSVGHQARLFAGVTGGGVLAAGRHRRQLRDRGKVVEKAFLDAYLLESAGAEHLPSSREELAPYEAKPAPPGTYDVPAGFKAIEFDPFHAPQ